MCKPPPSPASTSGKSRIHSCGDYVALFKSLCLVGGDLERTAFLLRRHVHYFRLKLGQLAKIKVLNSTFY